MLVMYKGYGYWEYDSDELNMVIREGEQYMKSCLFMLPEDAEKEIVHKGEAIVSYLLMSKDSDINEPLYNYPCTNDEPRFVLCNDDPIFENGYQQLREQKTVKYVREDIIPKLLSDDESKKQIIKLELNKEKTVCKQIISDSRNRKDNLTIAIFDAIDQMGKKPSLDELWQYFIKGKDKTGIIEDYTDVAITWRTTKGIFKDTKKASIANRLSRIKI